MPYLMSGFNPLRLFWSPKPEDNDSNTSSSDVSIAERLDRQRMSPNTRTKQWLDSHTPRKTDRSTSNPSETPSVLDVKGGKVSKQVVTPKSNLKSASKAAKKPVNVDSKAKRSGLLNSLLGIRYCTEEEVASPAKSEGQYEGQYEGATLIDDEVDDHSHASYEGDTIVQEQKIGTVVQDQKVDTIVQDQQGDLHKEDEDDFSDFTKEEYFLFHKLNERGFEPILPANWHWHFRHFPGDLFTNNPSRAYISHTKGPEFQAMKMLRLLVDAGLRVRECMELKQNPAKPLHDAVKKYFKWTMQDAKLDKKEHVPILSITCAKEHESPASLIGRCTDRLHSLGREYHEMWRVGEKSNGPDNGVEEYIHELPTLFGIVITQHVVGFLTYDARYPGKAVRSLGNWNFSLDGQDVWHAFALAIFMICARDYLMDLDEEGLLGKEIKEEEDDPDA